MGGRGNFRSMPSDFAEHANESINEIMLRYHAGQEVARRWKQISGTLRETNRAVIRIDSDGKEVRFDNVKSAMQDIFHPHKSGIYHAIKYGGSAYGYSWRWCDELEE